MELRVKLRIDLDFLSVQYYETHKAFGLDT